MPLARYIATETRRISRGQAPVARRDNDAQLRCLRVRRAAAANGAADAEAAGHGSAARRCSPPACAIPTCTSGTAITTSAAARSCNCSDRGIKLPLTMGHENVGEVVAVGPDAKGVKVGDVRLVHPWMGCGECKVCKRGEENLCLKPCNVGVFANGGYATHLMVPHPRYLFDIGDLSPEQAAPLACSGVTAYGALKKVDAATLTRRAGRHHRRRRRRPDGRWRSHKKMGGKQRSSSISMPASATRRMKAGAIAGDRRRREGCGRPDPGGDRRRRVGGDRFRRLGRDREARRRLRSSRAAR